MKIIVYIIALVTSNLVLLLSITSLLSTNWIKTSSIPNSPIEIKTSYGLFKRCYQVPYEGDRMECRTFPDRKKDCSVFRYDSTSLSVINKESIETLGEGMKVLALENERDLDELELNRTPQGGKDWGFCDKWITAGYLSIISTVFSFVSVVAIILVLFGPRTRRESGWILISVLSSLSFIFQIASMSIVVDQYRNDWRFTLDGNASLGQGAFLNIGSWILGASTVAGLLVSTKRSELQENRYRIIPRGD